MTSEEEDEKVNDTEKPEEEDADDIINLFGFEEKNGKILTKKLQLDANYNRIDISNYSQLCTEIK